MIRASAPEIGSAPLDSVPCAASGRRPTNSRNASQCLGCGTFAPARMRGFRERRVEGQRARGLALALRREANRHGHQVASAFVNFNRAVGLTAFREMPQPNVLIGRLWAHKRSIPNPELGATEGAVIGAICQR